MQYGNLLNWLCASQTSGKAIDYCSGDNCCDGGHSNRNEDVFKPRSEDQNTHNVIYHFLSCARVLNDQCYTCTAVSNGPRPSCVWHQPRWSRLRGFHGVFECFRIAWVDRVAVRNHCTHALQRFSRVLFFNFSWRANNEGVWRTFEILQHKGPCAHHAAATDHRAVHHDGAHANKCVVLNGAAVQNYLARTVLATSNNTMTAILFRHKKFSHDDTDTVQIQAIYERDIHEI